MGPTHPRTACTHLDSFRDRELNGCFKFVCHRFCLPLFLFFNTKPYGQTYSVPVFVRIRLKRKTNEAFTFEWMYSLSSHLKSPSLSVGNQPSDNEVEQLMDDAEKYTLANHLFWGIWGIISVSFVLLSLLSRISRLKHGTN